MKTIEYISECISHIINVSDKLKLKCYIHGGLVPDIMKGKLLRNHSTIYVIMENMHENIEYILNYLKEKGLELDYSGYIKSLHVSKYYINDKKEFIKIIITSINFHENTAIWKYLGEYGFICFPREWLDKEYRNFYGLNIYTSGIELEYCYKILFRYLKPYYPNDKVEKHLKAMEYYENEILEKNINPFDLFKKIWCYSPYWHEKGYSRSGYEPPILVLGKDVVKNNHRTQNLCKRYIEKNKKNE